MNAYEFPASITALSIAIAESTPDNDELYLISTILVELGVTLQTIVAKRILLEKKEQSLSAPPPP